MTHKGEVSTFDLAILPFTVQFAPFLMSSLNMEGSERKKNKNNTLIFKLFISARIGFAICIQPKKSARIYVQQSIYHYVLCVTVILWKTCVLVDLLIFD